MSHRVTDGESRDSSDVEENIADTEPVDIRGWSVPRADGIDVSKLHDEDSGVGVNVISDGGCCYASTGCAPMVVGAPVCAIANRYNRDNEYRNQYHQSLTLPTSELSLLPRFLNNSPSPNAVTERGFTCISGKLLVYRDETSNIGNGFRSQENRKVIMKEVVTAANKETRGGLE